MPQNYYTTPDKDFPYQKLAILERIRYYICSTLYPDETYTESQKRFLLTDMSPTMALRESVSYFNLTNAEFPFTAYSIGDTPEFDDTFNMWAVTKRHYSSVFNTKVYARPMILEIPMISFFATVSDYNRAKKLLHEQNSAKTQLDVPIYINEILTSFPILVGFEIGKGSYAFEFEEQLRIGKISDLVHNLTINYHDMITDDSDLKPVDDIEVALKVLETYKTDDVITTQTMLIPDPPEISSTNPADGDTDVDVTNSIIINFSTPMMEQSVEDYLEITPPVSADLIWNEASTSLVIDPVNDLENDTVYTIEIFEEATSGIFIHLVEDYSFSFTTEA